MHSTTNWAGSETLNGKAAVLGSRNKPPTRKVDPDEIHDGLKMFDRWVGWNWVWDEKRQKWNKPPINAKNGRLGSSTDPDTWSSFEQAIQAQRDGTVDGIGFVLGEADGGVHFSGIDLDDCRDPGTGELTEMAQDIIVGMNTYTEVSPSETGLKLFLIGKLPEGVPTKSPEGDVEIYTHGRYFTVTGNHVPDTPKRVEQRQKELEWHHDILIAKHQKNEPPPKEESQEEVKPHRKALADMLSLKVGNEQDGSGRLLLCGKIAVEHDLSDQQALVTWHIYKRAFPFPADWTDADFLRRIRDAEKKADRGVKSGGDHVIEYTRITAGELADGNYDTEFLIEGTMVAGQPLIICGSKKTLKTSMIIDAAVSLASCGFFLGRLRVNRQCRVGVMSGESGVATLKETQGRVCKAANIDPHTLSGRLIYSPDIPLLGRLDHLDAVSRFIERDQLEVLVVDPTYLAMPGADAGNLFIQGEMLRGINERCQQAGTTLVFAHHAKQHTGRDRYDPPELEDISWAGFQEFARQWWLLGRRERYEPGTGDHRLWLNIGGSAGHSSMWAVDVAEGLITDPDGRRWEVELSRPTEAVDDAEARKEAAKEKEFEKRLEGDCSKIIKAMTKLGLPDTATVIRTRAGFSGERFNLAIASLLEEGHVVEAEIFKGNRKTPYMGYALNNAGNPK